MKLQFFNVCEQEVLGMDAVLGRALSSNTCLTLNIVFPSSKYEHLLLKNVLKKVKTFISRSAKRNSVYSKSIAMNCCWQTFLL